MKRIRLNDAIVMTQKFVDGELTLLLDESIDPEGKESVVRDGKYFEFNDGARVHCRFSEGDSVAVMMKYRDAGLPAKVFGGTRGWNDRKYVDALYMPHRMVIEKVRCVRVSELTEEEMLRSGVRRNHGGAYLVGGAVGGSYGSAEEAFQAVYSYLFRVPYQFDPWVIVYDVTPVIGRAEAYGAR